MFQAHLLYNIEFFNCTSQCLQALQTGLVNLLHPGCVIIVPFERGHVLSGSGGGLLWCHVIFINAWEKKTKKTTKNSK